uniref:Calnexin homolog n=1 Tax=Daucus carota subsp. sativus TaxID=79200 RepID=A0A164U851_DAUCS
MEEAKRRIIPFVFLLIISSFAFQLFASTDPIFYESFDEDFSGRWIASEKDEYQGVWKHSKSEGHDDYGLLVSEKARKYAIVKELDEPVKLNDGTIVLQFETRLQNGLECGDDWDEDAPLEIEDAEAVKPEGWLDDEPEEIEDPEASKPEDWDDEEDGEWEAPKIENPKCEDAPGCGEWKRPMKRNPAYKGKWHAPLIDNPNYKGIWKPQQISNPAYFELDKPAFEPIAAIGIEIWTMQDGILFDNILIASDEKVAESYRQTTWKPKFDVEKAKQKAEEETSSLSDSLKGFQKVVFDQLYKIADIPFLQNHKFKILDLIEKAEKQPNITIGVLVSIVVVIFTALIKLLFGGKKPATPKVRVEPKKEEVTEASNNGGDSSEEKERNEDTTAAPRRRTRRDD